MIINTILAEYNGTNAFTFKMQERDSGGSVLDSYTVGDISVVKASTILKSFSDSGLFNSNQIIMKISSTEFNPMIP